MIRETIRTVVTAHVLLGAGLVVHAQRDSGPELAPPPAQAGNERSRETVPAPPGRVQQNSPAVSQGASHYAKSTKQVNSEMKQVVAWHLSLFGEEISGEGRRDCGTFLEVQNGDIRDVPGLMLASEEFFREAGGTLEQWMYTVGEVTGQPVSARDIEPWLARSRNESAVKIRAPFVQSFRAPIAIRAQQSQSAAYQPAPGPGDSYGPSRSYTFDERPYSVAPAPTWGNAPLDRERGRDVAPPPSYYGDRDVPHGRYPVGEIFGEFRPHGGHDHGHDHYDDVPSPIVNVPNRPVARPRTEPEIIADWYRVYFGRSIAQWEIQKWMSDRAKGMPLSEVYASVLASSEWYQRNGNDPASWIAANLHEFGDRDPGAIDYWMRRFQRTNGDRLAITKEMVQRYGFRPGSPVIGSDHHVHDHGHDDHDHDEEMERELKRREREMRREMRRNR